MQKQKPVGNVYSLCYRIFIMIGNNYDPINAELNTETVTPVLFVAVTEKKKKENYEQF